MFGKARVAIIAKAGGQNAGDTETFVDLTQEEQAAIAAEMAARKTALNAAGSEFVEKKGLRRPV
jgi:hypothetical protein